MHVLSISSEISVHAFEYENEGVILYERAVCVITSKSKSLFNDTFVDSNFNDGTQ